MWPSCNLAATTDGFKKCIRANGEVDETSIMLDMSEVQDKTGCFVAQSSECGTDMTLVSKIEFDVDFEQCQDVWSAPLWISPYDWKMPGGTSGEIDFAEMCPVGSVATNFGAGGQPGEEQEKWRGASGASPNGPKHFILTLDGAGNLKTKICALGGPHGGGNCVDGAHYDVFLSKITSKIDHHFNTDIWNGHGGDGGWTGCQARNNPNTNCRYAVMNIQVETKSGRPLYRGKCAALNPRAGITSGVNSTMIV